MAKIVMRDKSLSASAKGLYAYLAVFCDSARECYPSRERIADELGITGNTLGKLLRQLTNAGYLEITHEKARGRFARNRYRLTDAPLLNFSSTKFSSTEKSSTVFSSTENEATNSTIVKNTTFNKTNFQERVGASPPAPSPAKEKRFTPPTVEEVRTYCRERGSTVDAEAFVSYYDSNGWKVGKNPMKSWKAALVTWEKRDHAEGKRIILAESDPNEVTMPF